MKGRTPIHRRLETLVVLLAVALLSAACSDTTDRPTVSDPPLSPTSTTTTTLATTTSTSTTAAVTVLPTTTTTEPADDEARRLEIEAIVGALLTRRYAAIFDGDDEALLGVHGEQGAYDLDIEAIADGRLDFTARPSSDTLAYTVTGALLDRTDCIVIEDSLDVSDFLDVSGTTERLRVIWPWDDGGFRLGTIWDAGTPDFAWLDDCDVRVRGVTP